MLPSKLKATKIVRMTDTIATQMLSSLNANLARAKQNNLQSSAHLITLWQVWPTQAKQQFPSTLTKLHVSEDVDGLEVEIGYESGMDVLARWSSDWQEADEEAFFMLDDLTLSFPKENAVNENAVCKFRFDRLKLLKDLNQVPRLRESSAYEGY